MAKAGTLALSEQLRRAIDDSGMSRYAICKAVGLPESNMSRFMAGRSGLSLATVDRISELLGLTLVGAKRTRDVARKGKTYGNDRQ